MNKLEHNIHEKTRIKFVKNVTTNELHFKQEIEYE